MNLRSDWEEVKMAELELVRVMTMTLSLAVKLGSIARHAEEFISGDGRAVDIDAIAAGLQDPDVKEWMSKADSVGLLPLKRNP